MVANSDERRARIHDLEMKHQKSVHQIDLVNKDEESRQLKLRLLALRDDNASLKDAVSRKDARIAYLQRQTDDFRADLEETQQKSKAHEQKIKQRISKQDRDISDLQTHVESLKVSLNDCSKALEEKFALARELNRMKPEMKDLQLQLKNHSAVVAEKLSLQRQLSSIEVELENERRSKQRSKQMAQDEIVNEWKTKFEAAQKTHASEKKEWEKVKKNHDRELRELQDENERLEDRISTMKSKLKNTQSELKDAQAELATCQAELAAAKKPTKTARAKKVTVEEPTRKRRANDMTLDDITIGTPGPGDLAFKRPSMKRGAERALVGEKSTFSITPFLNRTKNLSDDSIEEGSPTGKMSEAPEPIIDEEAEEDASLAPVAEIAVEEIPAQTSDKPKKKSAIKTQKARGRPKAKALSDAPISKKNIPVPPTEQTETLHFGSKLEIVAEEPEGSEQENMPALKLKKGLELKPKAFEPRTIGANTSIFDAVGKKKKRKLLGGASKTLFEDEDGEAVPAPAKPQLGAKRLKAKLGGTQNAFAGAAFSPLKKDRRGVNASFLA